MGLGETKIKVEEDDERLGIREFRVFHNLWFKKEKKIWVLGLGFFNWGLTREAQRV